MTECPTCGKDLTYIAQYERWYCFAESKYAPKDFAPKPDSGAAEAPSEASHEGHYHCPSCGKELTFIEQYNRYYCFPESKYAPKDLQPIGAKPGGIESASPEELVPVEESSSPSTPELSPAASPAPAEPSVIEPAKPEIASEPAPSADGIPLAATSDEPSPSLAQPSEPEAAAPATEAAGPELKRDAVTKAKKGRLVEWCKAYGIDPIGSRTVLRDRLLEYMDAHKIDETEEEAVEEGEEGQPEAKPAPVVETTPPAAEPVSQEPVVAAPASALPPAEEPKQDAVPEMAGAKPDAAPEMVQREPEATRVENPRSESPAPMAVERAEPAAPVEAPKEAPAPAPAAIEIAKALACPTCGKDLTYIAKYDRLYCYAEGKYAPKGYGKTSPEPAAAAILEAPKPPPTPAIETPVARTPLPPIIVEIPKPEVKVANPCPTCGRALRYVKDYDRWWCEAERKYAPKDYGRKNVCPTCGKELAWIPEYQRWYCYSEFKYAPKTIPPPPAGAAVAVERPITATPAPPAVRVVPAAARAQAAAIVSGVARAEHLHGKPGAGIGLAATGFALVLLQYMVQPITGVLPVLGILLFDPATSDGVLIAKIVTMLGFTGLILALAGIVVGLRSVRSR